MPTRLSLVLAGGVMCALLLGLHLIVPAEAQKFSGVSTPAAVSSCTVGQLDFSQSCNSGFTPIM